MTEVIPPRQSRWFGPFIMASGVLALLFGVYQLLISLSGGLSSPLLLSAFLFIVGALLVFGGQMIAARRGGLVINAERLVLFGDSATDPLGIPTKDLRAIAALPLQERWGDLIHSRWVIEAFLTPGPRILLGESDDEHGLKHVAHQITQAGKLSPPVYESPPPLSPVAPSSPWPSAVENTETGLRFRVGLAGNLGRTLLASGIAMFVVGIMLITDIANNNVFGFLFGPMLAILGIALGGIPITKRSLIEHIQIEPGALYHRYEAFGFRWGQRSFSLSNDVYVRIRQRGLLGANLEIVSTGRILHLAGGVHAGSDLNPQHLLWLGQHIQWLLAAQPHPDPPSEDAEQEADQDANQDADQEPDQDVNQDVNQEPDQDQKLPVSVDEER